MNWSPYSTSASSITPLRISQVPEHPQRSGASLPHLPVSSTRTLSEGKRLLNPHFNRWRQISANVSRPKHTLRPNCQTDTETFFAPSHYVATSDGLTALYTEASRDVPKESDCV